MIWAVVEGKWLTVAVVAFLGTVLLCRQDNKRNPLTCYVCGQPVTWRDHFSKLTVLTAEGERAPAVAHPECLREQKDA